MEQEQWPLFNMPQQGQYWLSSIAHERS